MASKKMEHWAVSGEPLRGNMKGEKPDAGRHSFMTKVAMRHEWVEKARRSESNDTVECE